MKKDGKLENALAECQAAREKVEGFNRYQKENQVRLGELIASADAGDTEAESEIVRRHCLAALFPARIAAAEERANVLGKALVAEVHRFTNELLGSAVREKSAKAEAAVRADLARHFEFEGGENLMAQAVARSKAVQHARNFEEGITLQYAETCDPVKYAQKVMDIARQVGVL
jgi:hypothetical protein